MAAHAGDLADPALAGKQEACKTFLEQTKQLISLASAFLFAPAAVFTWSKEIAADRLATGVPWLIGIESCFVVSVILGYVTIGTIAGTQNEGKYDVYRPAMRWFALAQFATYVIGLGVFGRFIAHLYL
jgi:hypothetical protein